MKKCLCLVFCLALLLNVSSAVAADMGVQIIGGPEMEAEPVSLDDIKLNIPFTIDGYGSFEFTSVGFADYLASYGEGQGNEVGFIYLSQNEAEFLLLRADILNCTTVSRDYLSQVEVKVVYNEVFEYAGWAYQYNYNNGTDYSYCRIPSGDFIGYAKPKECVISPKDNYAIGSMYEGHYVFGCTLPNAVVNDKAPLKMIITIAGNELTFNLRK